MNIFSTIYIQNLKQSEHRQHEINPTIIISSLQTIKDKENMTNIDKVLEEI